MNLYQIVYHIVANFIDGMGVHNVGEVVQSTTVFVYASTQQNAATALTASLTIPDNGYVEIQACDPIATNCITGS